MTFDEYSSKFASECTKCNGRKYVEKNEEQITCNCQLKAVISYRNEQIPIDLRDLDWDDYTGDTVKENSEKRVKNWAEARALVFNYCFSEGSQFDKAVVDLSTIADTIHKHRISRSRIASRLKEGSNLVILGDNFTGKTFLAALVAKEIIYASVLLSDFDFKWISFNRLINAVSFSRDIDEELIDEVSSCEFLVLDNVYIPAQGDYRKNILDGILYDRMVNKLPIVLTGSLSLKCAGTTLGDEFFRLLNSPNTKTIGLELEKQ